MSALDEQVGGNHYKDMAIQPITYIVENKIPYREANVIKYVSRHASKNGIEDLKKARHYLDMLIEEYGRTQEEIEADSMRGGLVGAGGGTL